MILWHHIGEIAMDCIVVSALCISLLVAIVGWEDKP